MRAYAAKQTYDPVVKAGRGRYLGGFRNPVSRPIVGAGGQPYCMVFVLNPMNGDEIDRVLVSEEDVEKIGALQEIVITNSGEVIGRRAGSRVSSLEYYLFGEQLRHIAHINGNLLDFRRMNIRKTKQGKNGQCALEQLAEIKGYWNMSFDGSTRALISLCIRDDPSQSWEKLVKRVSEIKGCPLDETTACLKEFERRGMLGYHENAVWKEWNGR